MKLRFLVPLVLIVAMLFTSCKSRRNTSTAKSFEISGIVTVRQDYCGGAAPTEDQENGSVKPANGTVLYVCRQSESGDRLRYFDSIVCDQAGQFSIQLPEGTYSFVEAWKTRPLVFPADSQFEKWDTACYRQEYNRGDFVLQVKDNTSDVKITLRRRCPWNRLCCRYSGPLPPSAPPTNRGGNQPGHQE